MIGFLIILTIAILSISCVEPVSAQSATYVYATKESGESSLTFIGTGNCMEWHIDVNGFDYAYTDLTNSWGTSSTVVYNYISNGEIYVKVNEYSSGDEFYYFEWEKEIIDGNGVYTKGLPGARQVTVTNSTNVTGWIDYRIRDRKAVFQFDTRSDADLTVCVHNGHTLENASVILTNGAREVKWTDENGEAEFSPHTGLYVLVVEADGYDAMLVEDLTFESDKSYRININMTECISSCGSAFCSPSGDALIMYYREKEPSMDAISPQQFVNFFSDRLRTCMGNQDKSADGTLERMMTRYGVAPDPPLNVLLYDCNFTKVECDQNGVCMWDIEFIVKNYQQYNCNYTVNLICDDTITEIGLGELMPTWSMDGKKTGNVTVEINGDCNRMHLAVLSEKIGD